MPVWLICPVALVALYVAALIVLALAGRRGDAVALARLVPDCAVLFARLARDGRVRRRWRLALLAGMAYLASPLDLVPDMIPVVGQADDALLVALILRGVARSAGGQAVAEHWPGPPQTLALLARAAGVALPAPRAAGPPVS